LLIVVPKVLFSILLSAYYSLRNSMLSGLCDLLADIFLERKVDAKGELLFGSDKVEDF